MSRGDLVTENRLGRIVLTGGALTAHAVRAAQTIHGVRVRRPRRGVGIEIEDGRVHVALRLAAAAGTALPAVGEAIQGAVAQALRQTTGYAVTVDVTFDGIDA
jgi:uncharacterized alkaline shock family protein YloU